MKLTKTIRESIAKKAVLDLLVPALLEQFESVKVGIFALVKDQFKDFDWEHVEPYRGYIDWTSHIHIRKLHGEWCIGNDEFRRVCGLPLVGDIKLPFEIPCSSGCCWSVYLDDSYKEKVEDILRPYMVQYLTAEKVFKNIKQVLLGINTFKQLEDTLPELVKYLPERATRGTTALVPIEQINRVKVLFQLKQTCVNVDSKNPKRRSK